MGYISRKEQDVRTKNSKWSNKIASSMAVTQQAISQMTGGNTGMNSALNNYALSIQRIIGKPDGNSNESNTTYKDSGWDEFSGNEPGTTPLTSKKSGFKMKGSPMKRNFGVGSDSPVKNYKTGYYKK